MYWLLLTILSIVSRAIFGVATKVLSNRVKVSPISQSVLLLTTSGLIVLPLSPLIGGLSFDGVSGVIPLVVVMVVSSTVGNILFFKGLEKLDASTAQVLFSSILVWATILSIVFLGSQLSLTQLAGVALLLLAILLVQYKKGIKVLDANSWYLLIAALFFAVFQISSAELSKTISVGAYIVLAYLGGAAMIWSVYPKKVTREIKTLSTRFKETGLIVLFAATSSLLYAVFAYLAYASAPDRGVVVLLLTSQVVLGVILAIVFLKEQNQLGKKITAGVLAFIAGLLIKS